MSQTPRVWRKFTVKSKDGELKLRIQDMPSDRLNDFIDICMKYFIPQETCNKTAVVGEIIGASITKVDKKDDPERNLNFTTKTKEVGASFAIISKLISRYNALKDHKLDIFLNDRGVVVNPKYRGLGLAQMFFNVRRQICHDIGIPLTGAWMTAAGSQKAAARDGWETAYEMTYEDFGKETGIVFENVPPICKYMTGKPLQM
ncbi:uncharacterized protein LOC135074665 isoform X2 [Ostrinia nubilalis]|uniref:uncharacterized protein LOC135074665 isoform X2 n=1 Tax=Ostrinia nubilalis TaxID=29057 RepID=UPI00308229C5